MKNGKKLAIFRRNLLPPNYMKKVGNYHIIWRYPSQQNSLHGWMTVLSLLDVRNGKYLQQKAMEVITESELLYDWRQPLETHDQ
jgi:hypothetical protein